MKKLRLEKVQLQLPLKDPYPGAEWLNLVNRELRSLGIKVDITRFHDTLVISSFSRLYTRIGKDRLQQANAIKTI